MLRNLLDKIEPLFHKGGKLEKLYPLYEANDTFLYTPGEITEGGTHVRDAIDTKRMMTMVIVALLPCIFMALYNTGFQAQKAIASQIAAGTYEAPTSLWNGSWRYLIMDTLFSEGWKTAPGSFLGIGRMFCCAVHGALFFIPVYLVTMIVGGHCELIFSVIRKHEINEGFLVTGMLFPLTLPPNIPLWQVAIGIAFGVVIGKEIFGGTGRNFLNPALTARAFLYFAYPTKISGDAVWTAVDAYSGATALGQLYAPQLPANMIADGQTALEAAGAMSTGEILAAMPAAMPSNGAAPASGGGWLDFLIGNIHGSMGETSVICCLIGAAILIASRIGSWRIMAGSLLGMIGFSLFVWLLPFAEPVRNVAPWWHLVIGGFAFGTVFMATDPVSAAMTLKGKWIYGILIGGLTVMVRSINPAFPEGIMLAILFANVFAPLIDYYVVQQNVKRRVARYAA